MNIRIILLHVTALFAAAGAEAQNPIIQTIYTADPAPMVYKDTVYLYTGHDEDRSTTFVMKDWHCFTSTDMVNWTDRGSPLSVKTFSWAKQDAWAGQCIARNGKFYWYVPMTHETMGMSIGVAVSDSPAGQANVASAAGGFIEIHVDSRDGELLGSCEVKNTGSLQNWTTVSTKVNKAKGIHDLYFVFKGDEGDLFNFNWWKFDK